MKTKWDVDFEFEVGTAETHHLTFHWGQALGDVRLTVDGADVLRQVRPFGVNKFRRYDVSIGDGEVHSVTIEKQEPLISAGVRKQVFQVLVDGNLYSEYWHQNADDALRPFAHSISPRWG